MPPKPKQDLAHRATCANCRFWDRLEDAEQRPGADVEGECCVGRPIIVLDEEGGFTQASVVTPARRRACADHKPEVH